MTRSTITRAAVALAATALLAAACGDGEESGDGTDVETTVVAAAPATTDSTTDTPSSDDGSADGEPAGDETAEDETAATVAEPRFVLEGTLPLTTAEVNDMVAFVEEASGRTFNEPPVIVAQNTVDFEAGLAEMVAENMADAADNIDTTARTYQALGLSDQTPDELLANIEAVVGSSEVIGGYYDPDVDKLYVPVDGEASGLFRSVLVHELVHALDDQYIDLAQIIADIENNPLETETNFALQAVVEGRATAVQGQWMTTNSIIPDQPEITPEMEAVPPIILNNMTSPYLFGSGLVQAEGGAASTWELYDNLPASSEEIMFPAGSTGGAAEPEEVVDLAAPTADGPELATYEFGAVSLALWLLSDSLQPDPAVANRAIMAADGWAGGHLVLWGDEAESCVRIALAADSDTELTEIETAVQGWVDGGEGRTVESADGVVTATGCAPFTR